MNTVLALLGISFLFIQEEFKKEFTSLFYILLTLYIILGIIPLIQFALRASKR